MLGRVHCNLLPVAEELYCCAIASNKRSYGSFVPPSDYFQKSLPILKVPPLKDTIEKYLRSQKAILDPKKFSVTESAANAFLNGRGQTLQKQLTVFARSNRDTSYISQMWFDMYLTDRRPVVLTHNPVIVFDDTKLGEDYSQPVIRATNLVYSALQFCQSLRSNTLEPEVFHLNPSKDETRKLNRLLQWWPQSIATYGAYMLKAYPLDMSQYKNMFNATRIPRPHKDELVVETSARHLLVIHKGQFYVFDVLTHESGPVDRLQLLSNLAFIASQPRTTSAPGLGSLTAMERDAAVTARQRLEQLGNGANLHLVDSALFALVLDDAPLVATNDCSLLVNMLAGSSEDRWFDKSISIIVDRHGHAGVNFEHSWGDGVAVMRLCNTLAEATESRPAVAPSDLANLSSLPPPTVRRLEWLLDDHFVSDTLLPARQAYEARRHSLMVSVMLTENLNRAVCRQADVSPDAMIQLAFQVAYSRLHSGPPITYESCSTAAFKHGRTETIRPVTLESRDSVALLLNNSADPSDVFGALKKCSTVHKQLTVDAAMGKGWDRHLFALRKYAAAEVGRSLPEIFLDDAYTKINDITLSTSTISSPHISKGMFAPVLHDGYGIAYMIKNSYCGIVATSWDGSSNTHSQQFCEAFKKSADQLASVLKRNSNP